MKKIKHIHVISALELIAFFAIITYSASYQFGTNPFDGTTDTLGWFVILAMAVFSTGVIYFLKKSAASIALYISAFVVLSVFCWLIIGAIESVVGQT